MTTQTIRLLLTAPLKSDLTNLVNKEGAEISTMIAERSERILRQGQIRWKEDKISFPDCI
jgi:triphosphoribosyl-dephospho-CoA synthetase